MKKYNILFLFSFYCTVLQAQVVFDNQFPQPIQTISFTYTPQDHLISMEQIEAFAYLSNGKKEQPTIHEVVLQKTGSTWKGQVNTQNDTKALMLAFFEVEKTIPENNKGKGYVQIFCDSNKKPLSGAYASLAIITDFVDYLKIDKMQKNEWIKQEFKNFSDNKLRYFNHYVSVILERDEEKALEELVNLEKKTNLEEDEMNEIYYAYNARKDKTKMLEWEQKILAQYPNGKLRQNQNVMAIYNEDDTDKRSILISEFLQQFPQSSRKVDFEGALFWKNVKKDFDNKNKNEVRQLLEKAPQEIHSTIASFADALARNLAEKEGNFEMAEVLSDFAINVQRNLLQNLKPKNTLIPAMIKANTKYYLARYLDTYGWVLYKQEKYLNALGYFREAISIDGNNQLNNEYLEHYFLAQDKAEKIILENLVKALRADQEHKTRLLKLYTKDKQSEEGFDLYIAVLEKEGKRKAQEEILKKIINQKAPDFLIKDLENKIVNLKDLQGKVIVVDFWASWCAPCIAAFPGMQRAVSQYKDDDEVVFLFVATFDEEENVKEWAKNNKDKYSFYLLYDQENKMANAFDVKFIPNKFIIDKKGHIRFNSEGFDGSNEEVTRREMELMIETARKQ